MFELYTKKKGKKKGKKRVAWMHYNTYAGWKPL